MSFSLIKGFTFLIFMRSKVLPQLWGFREKLMCGVTEKEARVVETDAGLCPARHAGPVPSPGTLPASSLVSSSIWSTAPPSPTFPPACPTRPAASASGFGNLVPGAWCLGGNHPPIFPGDLPDVHARPSASFRLLGYPFSPHQLGHCSTLRSSNRLWLRDS